VSFPLASFSFYKSKVAYFSCKLRAKHASSGLREVVTHLALNVALSAPLDFFVGLLCAKPELAC